VEVIFCWDPWLLPTDGKPLYELLADVAMIVHKEDW
jgi:hypothetical protein